MGSHPSAESFASLTPLSACPHDGFDRTIGQVEPPFLRPQSIDAFRGIELGASLDPDNAHILALGKEAVDQGFTSFKIDDLDDVRAADKGLVVEPGDMVLVLE